MTFSDLRSKYSKEELSKLSGELKYKIFSPFFENLFENKLIYCERFICLVQVEDLQITTTSLSARLFPYLSMMKDGGLGIPMPKKPWTIIGSWDLIRLNNNSLNMPYAGFTLWPEYERVKNVERLLLKGSIRDYVFDTRRLIGHFAGWPRCSDDSASMQRSVL